ncbi:usp36 protein [Moniliophthora roreri MCA 2997]|uniref:Ubiquitin carboxyl-terminal hydrolase n=1 Tax=Moniliophthora roreri (strain MCA 2997) TaxID=1381753 RepID=V2XR93_MONRO|nr:usp36 protein [Moniliophthora roreri MCA 2997]
MLVSPLYPMAQRNFSPKRSESDQYRPAKDLEAFNGLLPPPIEFVEGSSTGTLAIAEGKYEPINVSPKASKVEKIELPQKSVLSTPLTSTPITANLPSPRPTTPAATPSKTPTKSKSLFSGDIELSWPKGLILGSGLYNNGNTCFLNSALQCLVHTPPLLNALNTHSATNCKSKGFCMSCNLRATVVQTFKSKTPFSPSSISNKLQLIAKHMRRGRQEDSHEFLRYAIDSLQKSCLAGLPSKVDHKLAETTWVHKIFGGRLRSRVTCQSCGYNSDTFDSILDLSLDIHHTQQLNAALRKFVAPDYLKGADKYKCEKCKKHVNAEKRFTIHDAPAVLTVHFKRFSPMGHKIGHAVDYEEHLSLQPYMSDGQFGPRYSLYGIICHAGGGPNSGHYYAFVKSREGKWYEMNDESVTAVGVTAPRIKNAYVLFYLKNKGQKLESVMQLSSSINKKSGLAIAMKKRKAREEDENQEDQGEKVTKPFIGPILPSTTSSDGSPSDAKRQKLETSDPQADSIKKKIEAAKAAQSTLSSLAASYASDDDEPPEEEGSKLNGLPNSSPPKPQDAVFPTPSKPTEQAIPASSFYGTPAPKKPPQFRDGLTLANRHSNWKQNLNPYSRVITYKKKRGPARGL